MSRRIIRLLFSEEAMKFINLCQVLQLAKTSKQEQQLQTPKRKMENKKWCIILQANSINLKFAI